MTRPSLRRVVPALVLVATVGGCGSAAHTDTTGSTTHAAAAATPSGATATVNPNARETLPPGDIPDTIAYVPFTDRTLGLTISVPEGWSRTTTRGRLVFTDKLNRVEVFTVPGTGAISPASVRATELTAIRRSVRTFSLQSITAVVRHAGPAVRTAYFGDSTPDPVTGKVGTLAFERYDFAHGQRDVVVLVSSPKGSDNVDPWRIITNSLRFGR